MNCQEWFQRLYQILDRDLDETVLAEVEEHMKHCRRCGDRYEFEVRLKALVKKSCGQEPCSETLRKRIKALLKKY
jgi:mycothiol system anti-sigma-R factor